VRFGLTDPPPIEYVRSGRHQVAYSVLGDGPLDLLFVQSFMSNIEVMWEEPSIARFLGRLAGFCRLILFDGRGSGVSDRVDPRHAPTLDERAEDAVAVLDAVGSGTTALLGLNGGGHSAIHLTVTHPQRVRALLLFNAWVHLVHSAEVPHGLTAEARDRFLEQLVATWGRPNTLFSDDETASRQGWRARFQRSAIGPTGAATAQRADLERDIGPLAAGIDVPVLVVQTDARRRDGELLVAAIPKARLCVVPAGEVMQWTLADTDPVLDEIEEFLTGARTAAGGEVVLMTIMFTDIVESTATQRQAGPRRWRKLVDDHDALVRRALLRHRGREVKTLGDGFLSVFDSTTRAVRCAADITAGVEEIGLGVRAGVHAGEVEMQGADVAGLAIVMARRVCDLGGAGDVLVSETVRSLLSDSEFRFADRGQHTLKGLPGQSPIFAASRQELADDDPPG
jgi:class 3 adenylate cyclase